MSRRPYKTLMFLLLHVVSFFIHKWLNWVRKFPRNIIQSCENVECEKPWTRLVFGSSALIVDSRKMRLMLCKGERSTLSTVGSAVCAEWCLFSAKWFVWKLSDVQVEADGVNEPKRSRRDTNERTTNVTSVCLHQNLLFPLKSISSQPSGLSGVKT